MNAQGRLSKQSLHQCSGTDPGAMGDSDSRQRILRNEVISFPQAQGLYLLPEGVETNGAEVLKVP